MPQVCPRVAPAYTAAAIGVERPRILSIASLLDRDLSLGSKQQPMPRRPRGQHAIHHVDAEAGVLHDLVGCANAHHVARLIGGKVLEGSFDHFAGALARLPGAESTDGIAGEADLDSAFGGFFSEVEIHAALDDAEEGLRAVPSTKYPVASACVFLS